MLSRIAVVLALFVASISVSHRADAQQAPARPPAADVVRYGELGFAADAAVYIAADEGLFAEQASFFLPITASYSMRMQSNAFLANLAVADGCFSEGS